MFKKIADLFFKDVELEDEEEIPVETIEVMPKVQPKKAVVPEKPKEVVVVKEEKEEPKTFVEVKEKSIFIDNTPTPKPKVKEVKPKVDDSYKFAPIISPIRGVKVKDKNEYEVNESKRQVTPPKKSQLGTVISPFFGLGKDNDEYLEEVNHDDNDVKDDHTEKSEQEKTAPVLDKQYVNLTLEDMISKDSVKVSNDKEKIHYFIGIKGTGMSALANLLDDAGYKVMGSDTENYVFTQTELLEKGISLQPFNSNTITDDMVVIIGNSFDDNHPDVIVAKNNPSVITYTYPEYLGKFISGFNSIAVSGSHGKTTTTSMISDMLQTNMASAHLIGDGRGMVAEDADTIVVEACEYKRNFLNYKTDFAVITNLEWDHVDYYKTPADYLSAFEEFANQIKDTVLIFGDDENAHKLNINTKVLYYGENTNNDIYAKNIVEAENYSSFDIVYLDNNIGNFKIYRPGRHMIHNAIAVIGIGLIVGLDRDAINAGLSNYKGARRRFEVTEIGESVVIDDYAHHPTELLVTLEAVKVKYPNHKLIAVYHPDRIQRLETFIDEYISALSIADQTAVCSAVDSDGMIDIIDTSPLIENLPKSFVVDDNISSVEQLAYLTPAVFVFMGTKEMHELKTGLIKYLHKIDY